MIFLHYGVKHILYILFIYQDNALEYKGYALK